MTLHPAKIYFSRSAVTTDWKCPRKRWWNYEYMGRGITPTSTNLAFFMGSCLHDGLAAIALGLGIDDIAIAAVAQMKEGILAASPLEDATYFANEQSSLVEGLLRGYSKHVWPNFKLQYPTILHVEKEMLFEYSGLSFMAKPDLIVQDTEGCYHYVEYKSTSSVKEQWINSWATAVQLHSSIRAVKATTGIDITSVIIQGLNKGYVSYGCQNSPFCYAYRKPGNPPFSQDQIIYGYKAGFKRYPVWELEGGVKAWVDGMSAEMLSQQFPQVPPLFCDDTLIDSFFRQQANREAGIRQSRDRILSADCGEVEKRELMDAAFPQYFEECSPGWGSSCEYKKLCFGLSKDPLEAGFELRVSHHELERSQHEDGFVGPVGYLA